LPAHLPSAARPVRKPTPPSGLRASLLADIDEPISDLARVEIGTTLADTFRSLSGQPDRSPAAIDIRAVELAREHLAAHACEQTPASTLEQISGTDRFTL